MKSFTFIEILVVIGITMTLVVMAGFPAFDFYQSQQLESQAREITQTVRRAQLKAMSAESDSAFGVYFSANQYVLFKGNSYISRDSAADEVFDLPGILTLEGLQEINFQKLEGTSGTKPDFCGGTCSGCSNFPNSKSCRDQSGCSWSGKDKLCQGTCFSCDSFSIQTSCQIQAGCSWNKGQAGGELILKTGFSQKTITVNEVGMVDLEL